MDIMNYLTVIISSAFIHSYILYVHPRSLCGYKCFSFSALQKSVDPNIKRYPTDTFSGSFLSSSMPQQPKETPPGSVVSAGMHANINITVYTLYEYALLFTYFN